MERICAVCGSTECVQVVCHHCGIPLCNSKECRYTVTHDPVFIHSYLLSHPQVMLVLTEVQQSLESLFSWKISGTNGIAYHCEECKNKYHSPFWKRLW